MPSRNRPRLETWSKSRIRVYCPGCGEVRGNERHGFPREHNEKRVFMHKRLIVPGGPTAVLVDCPGGPVDPVKDRAP